MVSWNDLSDDLKICVVIHKENEAGRKVWMSRIVKILKGDVSRIRVSKTEDRLYDLGIIDGKYEKYEGRWTRCFKIDSSAMSFVKNIVENLTGYPGEGP